VEARFLQTSNIEPQARLALQVRLNCRTHCAKQRHLCTAALPQRRFGKVLWL